jgi:predicted N-acyltransferase
MNETSEETYYRTRIIHSLAEVGQKQWDKLLQLQTDATPFMSYAFLHALHESGAATEQTGWKSCYLTIWHGELLAAAMPLYEKSHSYGEYVFDWAWADAYHQHGLNYYPKLLSAIPFTPVSGNRLMARDAISQKKLLEELMRFQNAKQFSSTHILFTTTQEAKLLDEAGFLLRQGIQFHWLNKNYVNFEDFLQSLEQKKRKNIRAERRKVNQAGIEFLHICGKDITEQDWGFFLQCYEKTYSEHHSSPYLNLKFFLQIGKEMPENIHLIFAKRNNIPIASSLLVHDHDTLYGRYWGCLEQVPCLHFETAYYQAIEFCIHQKIALFEGGAQGEHKMARGFLPQKTYSAHSLREPAFSDAVARFLQRETGGIEHYLDELNDRTPFKPSIVKETETIPNGNT